MLQLTTEQLQAAEKGEAIQSPEEAAAVYHLLLEAVLEAVEYVHANEEFLADERIRSRERATPRGYLEASE